MKRNILIVVFGIFHAMMMGQDPCDAKLLDTLSEPSSNEVYLKDFTFYLQEDEKEKSSEVKLLLRNNTNYCFAIGNSSISGSIVEFALTRDPNNYVSKGHILKNHEIMPGQIKKVNFTCSETAPYKIHLSFKKEKKSCVHGVIFYLPKQP